MANDIVRKIEQAGVAGAGGAGFPTHVKAAACVDTVVANYAECEPLVASDSAVISADPERMLEGLALMRGAVGATRAIVALKRKRKEQVAVLEELSRKRGDFTLHLLDDVYPAGDEHLLVEEVTGRVVPQGGIPPEVSVLVSNVTTLWRVALSNEGRAFTERYVTVVGEVRKPRTLLVPIGTSANALIEACGGASVRPFVIVMGGPMMGEITEDADTPVRKTTTAVIVLPPDNPLVRRRRVRLSVSVRRAMAACMQCMDCTLMCPRYLMGHQLFPHKIMRSVALWIEGSEEELASAMLCSECGLCGHFVCPMELSPVLIFQAVKQELVAKGVRLTVKRAATAPLPERSGRRVPVERLTARFGLAGYAGPHPVPRSALEATVVKIPLREKWGRLRPCVSKGASVTRGTVVAEPEGPGPGAVAHASIDGQVTSITEEYLHVTS
ncbi:MAG: SLBB domain-containing protein [Candidatus Eisenbacteria bacterium]|nr:SLBB domain-containing protein [Candidatus Eisenbacteria bacterium]